MATSRVAFRGGTWVPMLTYIMGDGERIPVQKLNAAEYRLYLLIMAKCRGARHTVEISNADAMTLARLDEWTLRDTRKSLEGLGLVSCTPGKRGSGSYQYTLTNPSEGDSYGQIE